MKINVLSMFQFLTESLSEEAGEFLQVKSKIARFGIDSYKPSDPDKKTNRTKLVEEMNDMIAVLRLIQECADAGELDLPGLGDEEFISKRIEKILHFAGVSAKLGLVDAESPIGEEMVAAADGAEPVTPELPKPAQDATPEPQTEDPTPNGPSE